jgi:shikimate kinase
MNFNNISLIGFMGSGKTTVGRILSEKTNFLFIDLDRIIEIAEEKSIPEIFKEKGEKYFRNMETEVIGKIYINKNCVFACGGGVVEKGGNMNIIKSNSTVIYLNVSPTEAYNRLKNVKDRPLLETQNGKEGVKEIINNLISRRDLLYRKYADFIINTDKKKPEKIVGEILEKLGE